MEVFDFALRLNRMPDDEQIEALFEAGCGDGTFSGGPSGAVAEFHREAESWARPEVAAWLRDVRGIEVDVSPDEIGWADDILADRLRQMEAEQTLAAADPAFTREFSRLLSVA